MVALDCGISEFDFWQMTLAEIQRAIESKMRVAKEKERKKASFDYVLADLIGRSVARVYNSSNKLPSLDEAYPQYFTSQEVEEKVQERKADLSALRFKRFAETFNSKFKGGNKDK